MKISQPNNITIFFRNYFEQKDLELSKKKMIFCEYYKKIKQIVFINVHDFFSNIISQYFKRK